jgi:hypothetical protein
MLGLEMGVVATLLCVTARGVALVVTGVTGMLILLVMLAKPNFVSVTTSIAIISLVITSIVWLFIFIVVITTKSFLSTFKPSLSCLLRNFC